MDDKDKLKDFPDISEKLNAPKKISVFERQRQEAETKRLREEAETRKALREFENSFAEDDDDDDPISNIAAGRGFNDNVPTGPRGVGLGTPGGPRHFPESSVPRAGPGSLGPPPSLKRKREFDTGRGEHRGGNHRDGHRPSSSGQRNTSLGLGEFDDDDEEERESRRRQRGSPEEDVRKPTMLLSNIPPGTKKDTLKNLMPASLKVEDVTFVDPPRSRTREQNASTAIVTVAAATPMSEVDNAVSALQNKYLGLGYYLNISRHVSSTSGGLGTGLHSAIANTESRPFGAKRVQTQPPPPVGNLRNAPPPDSLNLPPSGSYAPSGPGRGPRPFDVSQVHVVPPSDIKELKLIHRTMERLIQYGPAFEGLLMSQPHVQMDEKWAWLFDSNSPGGVWYRWLVWNYFSEDRQTWNESQEQGPTASSLSFGNTLPHHPFDGSPAWALQEEKPRYEFTTDFEELVEDSEYVSSDDESGDEGPRRQFNTGHGNVPLEEGGAKPVGSRYLNPYRRAKLTHLLARLPEAIALLRIGDVARVTNFVVNNAGQGAEEIVEMLIANVLHPFNSSVSYEDEDNARQDFTDNTEDGRKSDPSNSKLIGLYIISDSLQASSTSGVRDAWKYRSLFESALKSSKLFEHLGRLEKELQWGRMKAEQWKRKVGVVLGLWENWSVFPREAQKIFKNSFSNPPLSEEEDKAAEEAERTEKAKKDSGRWKDSKEEKIDDDERRADEQPLSTETLPVAGSTENVVDPSMRSEQAALTPPAHPTQPTRRARPRAEDLLDLGEDSSARAADLNARSGTTDTASGGSGSKSAPNAKLGGAFGFSMSLGSGSPAPAAKPKSSAGNGQRSGEGEDMFGESDGEGHAR